MRNKILAFIDELVKTYKYKPLPPDLSKTAREIYKKYTPAYLQDHQNDILYSFGFLPVCRGFERIVIGDYGAYVEFSPQQACYENFIIEPGQQYRLEKRYQDTIKYIWYRMNHSIDTKIYFQLHTVSYADYRKGYYYVSVFDIIPDNEKGEQTNGNT